MRHMRTRSFDALRELEKRVQSTPHVQSPISDPGLQRDACNASSRGTRIDSPRLLTRAYKTGTTASVKTVEDSIPPTIGAAMRRMTSEPVPVLHMIGSRPAV